MTSSAKGLVLLAHGARDPRWAEPLARLRRRIAERDAGVRAELAFLEHLDPDLEGAIAKLADAGCDAVTVVPVFLGQGGHVREDVPRLVAEAQRRFSRVRIRAADAAGDDAGVIDALATYCLSALTR
jgi:sirohydrochlorin cobaltochelatase